MWLVPCIEFDFYVIGALNLTRDPEWLELESPRMRVDPPRGIDTSTANGERTQLPTNNVHKSPFYLPSIYARICGVSGPPAQASSKLNHLTGEFVTCLQAVADLRLRMPYVYDCDELQGYILFLGRDKYENDALLEYSLPLDWWFHVDKHSSAHVYVRPKRRLFELSETSGGTAYELSAAPLEPPTEVLRAAAAVAKENSIEGAKQSFVHVVYTPASNLLKSGDMGPGQVGFRDPKLVQRIRVARSDAVRLKQIKSSRKECTIDELRKSHEDFQHEQQRWSKAASRRRQAEERAHQEQAARERDARNYAHLHKQEAMTSNKELAENYEDEFL